MYAKPLAVDDFPRNRGEKNALQSTFGTYSRLNAVECAFIYIFFNMSRLDFFLTNTKNLFIYFTYVRKPNKDD